MPRSPSRPETGGLKGKERNELERLAGDVRSWLESGDLGKARTAVESLVDKNEDLDDELDEERARRVGGRRRGAC